MKKLFKIVGIIVLIIFLLIIGFGFYTYKTNPTIKAMVNNDESKLYYFPRKDMRDMSHLAFTEKSLPVADSVKIQTYFFKAATSTPKANIFLVHGAGGNVTYYQDLIQTLIKGNYNVYTVDWRGYGKSVGSPNYKGVMQDTQVAFKDFINLTQSDSLKKLVYGMSLGGQMAVKIVSENQNLIDALVLEGSFSSAQNIAIDYSPVSFLKQKAKESPQDFNQEYVAERDIKNIKNTPKLIIHSEVDKEVAFYHGQLIYDHAQEPKEFWKTRTKHITTLKELPQETIAKIDKLIL
ncbi:alpha/beta hydrolase [Adhaeribacter rhizoryzae]|uniref:Alpha/beta hydrolase n=1 Tax=Adhaeribacter rhizoryzae TaxID=2607907 RepID=A0A5M6DRV4_9BACT|nr:alpha/beta hydrolase [Adhaeribacter rhizoryzae]KAA5549056.1 alpha/beta hydrolase [Adhaeribacter rhizoryzae]